MKLKVIDKYLLKQFLNFLFFSILSCWIIWLIVDIIEHIDLFIDRGASILLLAKYYLYYTPFIVFFLLPVAMLLSTLFCLGLLAKNNELIAMKATGISLYRILAPLFVLAFLISLLTIGVNELILPKTNYKKTEIRKVEIEKKKKEKNILFHNVFVQGEDNRIFFVNSFNSEKNEGKDVLVQKFEKGMLKEQIEAKRIVWINTGWLFENGRYRIFIDSLGLSEKESFLPFDRLYRLDLKIKPLSFTQRQKEPEEMSYKELSKYIKVKKKAGQKVSKELTDLYLKFSYPLINLIILLFGAPISASPKRSGLAIGFAITLAITFVYWFFLKTFQSFGYAEKLPPLLSAWSANIIFGVLGIILLIKAKK